MSGFWTSPEGKEITGKLEDSIVPNFTVIPEGTMALAVIQSFKVENKEETQYKPAEKIIEVSYKITEGDFKNFEVRQKIKPFDGKPEAITRNLNMLKLIMDLCAYKPSHNNEPSNEELGRMCGKILGIKIGEWSVPTNEGKIIEGNFVREVHPIVGFKAEKGIKVVHSHMELFDSAMSRNRESNNITKDDIPF